jgi:anti-sigma regulatory factor (Ser/Thr protein kinase)
MEKVMQYKSIIQEIPRIRQDLMAISKTWIIPASELNQITVIVEELFSNIVRFAYEDDAEHVIEIRLHKSESEITLEVSDDGIPFDPLEYTPGSTSDPAASETGGMGLTLIKTFSDRISYHRENQRNCLVILKRLKSNQ